MKELNHDIETRDKIIYGKYRPNKYKFGGVQYFDGMDVKTLGRLLDNNFADPDDAQNLAPSINEIYEFMKLYPEYTAHGYSVSADRDDYRISIEGIEKGTPASSVEEFKSYMSLFSNCDEFNETTMYCWFD